MRTIHFTILLLAVLAFSCTKEKRYYLTEVDKQMIPYQVGDTIYGRDQWEKQKILTVRYIKTDWITDGYNDWLWSQWQVTHVQSEQDDFSFELAIYNWRDYDIKSLIISSKIGYSVVYDKNGKFVDVYDSLQINNKVYYDVAFSELENNLHQVYYNKTYGVLQIKEYGKTVFTLDTVIFADKR